MECNVNIEADEPLNNYCTFPNILDTIATADNDFDSASNITAVGNDDEDEYALKGDDAFTAKREIKKSSSQSVPRGKYVDRRQDELTVPYRPPSPPPPPFPLYVARHQQGRINVLT